MAYEIPGFTIGLEAAADLSAAQFKAVVVSAANTVNLANASSLNVIGVLQNKPEAAGRSATIMVCGVTKAVAGAAIAAGARVTTDANGDFITAALSDQVVGVALTAADDNDIFSLLIGSPASGAVTPAA